MRFAASGLSRAGVSACMLWLAAGGLAASGAGAPDADAQRSLRVPSSTEFLDFDLPAQPLASALRQYGAVSGRSVMFIDDVVTGRTSSAVQGRYAPYAALQALLAGTGFSADDVDTNRSGAFVLKRTTTAPTPTQAGPGSARPYDALVQARVWDALCADPRTVPGHYRSILRLQVTASGRIYQANLISSSGDGRRDAAMLTLVDKLQMEAPPPPDLAQPLTLAILPRDVLAGPGCQTVN